MKLSLRTWQCAFSRTLAAHRRDEFLLVACPAAGKTIAAGAAVAGVMAARDCDQLVVVCPTVVVRDQWAEVLGELGYRMATDFERDGWPEHVHGVCATYAQVSQRRHVYAAMCVKRGTVAVFDEIHHAGENKAWGDALVEAFAAARMRLMLSGTPFRSDRDRIPFIEYAEDGTCVPDFTYDYPRAVRDGVCRSIEFKAHDGRITWAGDDGEPVEATFKAPVTEVDRARRLRASLDPTQPYLAALLADAHADLLELRERVPDAGGLIVCDSQGHALEIDDLLNEITGGLCALAISDMPRAHQAIREFADSDAEWLVSVRMVAEGVDIPRLGVIAWATASKTELMVRQVAGRALRGRGDHANLPAIVHMPADPMLTKYAGRLDVLGGVSLRHRSAWIPGKAKTPARHVRGGMVRHIDPAPLVDWITRNELRLGGSEGIAQMLGWTDGAWARAWYRWRHGGAERGDGTREPGHPDVMTVYDVCHMLGVDFDELFAGEQYADAREFLETSGMGTSRNRAIDAQPTSTPPVLVAPALPAGRLHAVPEPVEISPPELPPSPREVAEAEQQRRLRRAELFRLLGIYTELRRAVTPVYQLATAHRELAGELGAITQDSSDEQIAVAIEWAQSKAQHVAVQHPEQVKQLARTRRRLALQDGAGTPSQAA